MSGQPQRHQWHHGGDRHHRHHRGGIRGRIAGAFEPHTHDPAASIDSALTASAEGLRALKISLIVLALTAAFQVVIVMISGSVALLGDTIHNFSDALTAVPLGIAFVLGRRPPTKRYTYGYGRSEDLAGIFVVVMIALSAAVAGWESIQRLLEPRPVHSVAWVVVAGVVGFLGNELVAVYRIRVGRKIGSAALVADGLHARTDGLTSLAVVLVKEAARDIYRRLMDSVEPELVDDVKRILVSVTGVQAVEAVHIRWIGTS